jgi:hypothetical protein
MEKREVCDKSTQVCEKCLLLVTFLLTQYPHLKNLQFYICKCNMVQLDDFSAIIKEGDRRHTS